LVQATVRNQVEDTRGSATAVAGGAPGGQEKQAEVAGYGGGIISDNSREAMDQLASVFAAYNETTQRMQLAHQRLKGEVSRLRRELQQKNEQLERKNRLAALGQMAAGIAHEIRNPLGGIQLYASLLESDLKGQEEQLNLVGKISKGVKSLDMIVNDILVFTQDHNCRKSEVQLAGLFKEVIDYVQPHIAGSQIGIDYSRVGEELGCQVDISMMRRVLLNLLLNAIDVLAGEGEIRISATALEDDSVFKICIAIADNGPGITPEVMGKIFNPFFTTKDTGTGLGLTIAYRLVECHGGQISMANNEGGGATFSILLP
jgi:signal transduction histidine kinase